MSPTGSITGERNSVLNFQIRAWNRQKNLGKVFDSDSDFKLPNGALSAPDYFLIGLAR